eukprot:scaffold319326_cov37-Prasinocladus_malaysianus.AAC.1
MNEKSVIYVCVGMVLITGQRAVWLTMLVSYICGAPPSSKPRGRPPGGWKSTETSCYRTSGYDGHLASEYILLVFLFTSMQLLL